MMSTNHRERQLMQHLRGGAWVKAITLPPSPKLIANLLDKGWIEQRGIGAELSYRITEEGLAQRRRAFGFMSATERPPSGDLFVWFQN